ncbi:MAG: PepSY domain-containing protein [Pseudorhodobacter sp.]
MIGRMARITAISVAAATFAAPALANAPALSDIIRSFEDRGYQITEIEVEAHRIEIEALDPNGQKVEIDVDRASGETLRERSDN